MYVVFSLAKCHLFDGEYDFEYDAEIVQDLIKEIKLDMQRDEFEESMSDIDEDINNKIEGYDLNELMGESDDDMDSEDGFDVDDLFS